MFVFRLNYITFIADFYLKNSGFIIKTDSGVF